MTIQRKSRITNAILLCVFIASLAFMATCGGLTSCSSSKRIISGFEQVELTDADKSYGFVEYSTISMKNKKKDRDWNCPATTTLYCKLAKCDNDPQIIKLCGDYDIENGVEVFVHQPLPTNHWDHNKYVIIDGYKYTMLE